ncbi:MAG: hypothetical protein PUP46_01000 [Endozoicomonas sp. (ex Botrylloides leachii)]|nr:hypothetical protein [Endozoicomonas sp. (ex Botrylloides leachii)]
MKAISLLFGCFMACFVTTAYSNSLNFDLVVELAEDTSLKAISILPCEDLIDITTIKELLDSIRLADCPLYYQQTILKNRITFSSAKKLNDKFYYFKIILSPITGYLEDTNPPTAMDITKSISLLLADLWNKKEYPFCKRDYPNKFKGFQFILSTLPMPTSQQYNADQAETCDYSMDDSGTHMDNICLSASVSELTINQEKPSFLPLTVMYYGDKNTPKTFNIINMHYQKIKEECIIKDDFQPIHTMANLEQPNQEAINSHSMASGQPATGQQKQHICTTCGQEFPSLNQLYKHSTYHPEGKPFKCRSCKRGFQSSSNYYLHIRKFHTEERSIKCKYCECYFFSYDQRTKHTARKHKEKKSYKCLFCELSFLSRNQRRLHIRKDHP